MVRGLEIFRTWFVDHVDQYVLIGGTAATLKGDGTLFPAPSLIDVGH
jgi:hypothetical protein